MKGIYCQSMALSYLFVSYILLYKGDGALSHIQTIPGHFERGGMWDVDQCYKVPGWLDRTGTKWCVKHALICDTNIYTNKYTATTEQCTG